MDRAQKWTAQPFNLWQGSELVSGGKTELKRQPQLPTDRPTKLINKLPKMSIDLGHFVAAFAVAVAFAFADAAAVVGHHNSNSIFAYSHNKLPLSCVM